MATLEGKVCIVTGSNTGIGKETARGLAQQGATVVMAVRDLTKGEAARAEIAASTGRSDVALMKLDLGDLASVRAFAREFQEKYPRLDILVNNAGVWTTSRSTTKDGFETTFGTNHLGTFLLTNELLPVLKKSAPARVVVLSSALHYQGKMLWDDLQHERVSFSGPTAYNQSKLANVLFANALARRVEKDGITVNSVHPGVVATELARGYPKFLVKIFHLFLLTPAQGAQCSLHVATSEECGKVTGKYFEKSRQKTAAKSALDESAQERLWKVSEELIAARSSN
jgi:NAD(P)-dependent dehydrogenase (short-subunit alcohol dehydrogenase family)